MITNIDKNTALVLIDLQYGIIRNHSVKSMLTSVTNLMQVFRKHSLPIVIVNVDPSKGAWIKARKDNPVNIPKVLPDNFLKIVEPIKTKPEDIFITKNTWNAFYNTPLHEKLDSRGITGIVLGGISTSIGVEGTARAASEFGYNISFATDAMFDPKEQSHQHSITNIFPRIGEVGTSEDIIKMMNRNI